MNLFSDEMRRNPYPVYDHIRGTSPVFLVPAFDAWPIFDYEGVKRVLSDHDRFINRLHSIIAAAGQAREWSS
jgi:cytochrome P450